MKLPSGAVVRVLGAALLIALAGGIRAAEKLPSAKEILERYGKAIGGKAAFQKHTSQHAKGSIAMPAQNLNGTMEVFAARPNKLVIKMNLPGVGEMSTAFNGTAGWVYSQLTGAMLLEGKMLQQVGAQANFDHALHDPSDYKTMEVLGVEDFHGEECYKVKLVHNLGQESTEYFSKKTGLQKGYTATQESPLGEITATTVVLEYKKFDDIYVPAKVSQKAAGMETVMTIDEVTFDKVDSSVFEAPAEVKALLDKPSQTTPQKGGEK